MNRQIAPLVVSATLLAASACVSSTGSGTGPARAATGEYAQESKAIGDFKKIQAANGLDVSVKIGAKPSVTFNAPKDVDGSLVCEVRGQTLVLGLNGNWSLPKPIHVDVVATDLDGINASDGTTMDVQGLKSDILEADVTGGSKLTMAGNASRFGTSVLKGSSLTFLKLNAKYTTGTVSGGSTISLSGTTDKVDFTLTGGSKAELQDLKGTAVNIDANGASTADVAPIKSLDARASGASTINYSGHPHVNRNLSGGSTVNGQ